MTTATLDTTAWHEGYNAGRRGHTLGSNPYPAGSVPAREWVNGFYEGCAKPLQLVRS